VTRHRVGLHATLDEVDAEIDVATHLDGAAQGDRAITLAEVQGAVRQLATLDVDRQEDTAPRVRYLMSWLPPFSRGGAVRAASWAARSNSSPSSVPRIALCELSGSASLEHIQHLGTARANTRASSSQCAGDQCADCGAGLAAAHRRHTEPVIQSLRTLSRSSTDNSGRIAFAVSQVNSVRRSSMNTGNSVRYHQCSAELGSAGRGVPMPETATIRRRGHAPGASPGHAAPDQPGSTGR
jgi:hypothetical protein